MCELYRECNITIETNINLAQQYILQTYNIKFCELSEMKHGNMGSGNNMSLLWDYFMYLSKECTIVLPQ
jgi:hypothetical protein